MLEIHYDPSNDRIVSSNSPKFKLKELKNANQTLASLDDYKSLYHTLKNWLKLHNEIPQAENLGNNVENKDYSVSDLREDLSSLVIDSVSEGSNMLYGVEDPNFDLNEEVPEVAFKQGIIIAQEEKIKTILDQKDIINEQYLSTIRLISQEFQYKYIEAERKFQELNKKYNAAEKNFQEYYSKYIAAERKSQTLNTKYDAAEQNFQEYKAKYIAAERKSQTLNTKYLSTQQSFQEYEKKYIAVERKF